jgi:uncharacterized membrane protein YfcA
MLLPILPLLMLLRLQAPDIASVATSIVVVFAPATIVACYYHRRC